MRYGRKLTVTVDGQTKEYWTTATTVDSALKDLGIRAEGAVLSASRSQPLGRGGLTLAVTTPKKVTFVADGKTRTVTSTSSTVFGLLAELGVTKKLDDIVAPAMPTALDDGMKVVLKRVTIKKVKATESIAYPVTKQNDASLYKGETKTVKPGKKGSKVVVRQKTWVDGKLTATKVVSQKVTAKPVAAVVKVGTKARPSSAPPSAGNTSGAGINLANVGHVGPDRPVRVRRQLEHQHRQRLLRRPAVRDRVVARQRWRRLRPARRPRVARRADHRRQPLLRQGRPRPVGLRARRLTQP